MTYAEILLQFAALDPVEMVYRGGFGETRGEAVEAQIGFGNVVRNRKTDIRSRWPSTWHDVLLQPKQFSCFNEGDPNLEKCLAPQDYDDLAVRRQLQWVAEGIVEGRIRDNVRGANLYYDWSIILGQPQDPVRLQQFLRATDTILLSLDPVGSKLLDAGAVAEARAMVHEIVAPLPPAWDDELFPVARKGHLIFFRT